MPLSPVLDAAGILPTGRFVVFYSYDDWVDSIDMLDALHPQTILAYGMNAGPGPLPGIPRRDNATSDPGIRHATSHGLIAPSRRRTWPRVADWPIAAARERRHASAPWLNG